MWLTQRFTAVSQGEGTCIATDFAVPGGRWWEAMSPAQIFLGYHPNTAPGCNQEQKYISPFSWQLANPHSVPMAETVFQKVPAWVISIMFLTCFLKSDTGKWSYLVTLSQPTRQSLPLNQRLEVNLLKGLQLFLWVVNIFVFEFSDSRKVYKILPVFSIAFWFHT